jgi:hypothetical protein
MLDRNPKLASYKIYINPEGDQAAFSQYAIFYGTRAEAATFANKVLTGIYGEGVVMDLRSDGQITFANATGGSFVAGMVMETVDSNE